MLTRRDSLRCLAALAELGLLSQFADARAQTAGQASPPRPPVFVHDLPNVTMEDWQVTVSEVVYEPGRIGTAHKHPGFVLAYVLEGAIVTKISGQGDEKTYTTGQMFYEQPGSTHEVSRNASQTQPARLLALIFAKRGLALTTPA